MGGGAGMKFPASPKTKARSGFGLERIKIRENAPQDLRANQGTGHPAWGIGFRRIAEIYEGPGLQARSKMTRSGHGAAGRNDSGLAKDLRAHCGIPDADLKSLPV